MIQNRDMKLRLRDNEMSEEEVIHCVDNYFRAACDGKDHNWIFALIPFIDADPSRRCKKCEREYPNIFPRKG